MTGLSAAVANQPLLMVLSIVLMSLLILLMGVVTWNFDLRRSRLPQATAWEDLSQRLVSLGGQIADKNAELQEIMQRIHERDRVAAEVAALTDQRDTLRMEIDSLAEGARQVEEMKVKAAEAAEAYARENGRLEQVQTELVELARHKTELEQQIERLRRDAENLPEARDELKEEITQLQRERSTLEDELSTLRAERGLLLAAREEMAALTSRSAQMQQEFEALQRELERLPMTHLELKQEIEQLQAMKFGIREELPALRREVTTARDEVSDMAARKAALEVEIERLRGEATGDDTSGEDELDDLRRRPLCLPAVAGSARPTQPERDALGDVIQHLKDLNLKYNDRTIRAFHTSLKINDISQMTVLAGVSGTGKSLLPRRYAEAMGLHFLQIAVEPRWDSPQDLLGFYNYVEKRYRGTELARALVHLDPFMTSGLTQEPLSDHMLLVLLDEMNLARVEYYFSEFLSRLEVRPRFRDVMNEARRRDACMPVDIRGRKQRAVELFPSHNVLFSGTMNDDESTQALSDKVLDRGNVMQFAAPAEFVKPTEGSNAPINSHHRSFGEWRKWIRPVELLVAGERDKAQFVISKLVEIMENFGRPFGHRLNEAILTYVTNYPRQHNELVDDPLADQIEFRILPKLRGVTIEEHQGDFDQLIRMIREDLRDGSFAERLEHVIAWQRNRSGQFNWRGLDRSQG